LAPRRQTKTALPYADLRIILIWLTDTCQEATLPLRMSA
jgi:hypothetical protein